VLTFFSASVDFCGRIFGHLAPPVGVAPPKTASTNGGPFTSISSMTQFASIHENELSHFISVCNSFKEYRKTI
jgi:hypothetical protein